MESVLTKLPKDFTGAILVVQHMPKGFTRSLAERFNRLCSVEVSEAKEDDPILPGKVYIAPSGYHMGLDMADDKMVISLTRGTRKDRHCPSVDEMMKSVARAWHRPLLGIIMTGMGSDGTRGIGYIKQRGGTVIAQDEDTCVVYGMPRSAYLSGNVDRLVPLRKLAGEINNFVTWS